ncbi:hypothetical protein M885DRAFT_562425 [Pelagophyceae sp. CCMP2097]|nr:hypothetical protein M885DRAFT_562425 [Pelagophyceae sp. CCMP2097]
MKLAVNALYDSRCRATGIKVMDQEELYGMVGRTHPEAPRRTCLTWLDERLRVVDPLSPPKLWWDSFVGAVLVACVVITPFQLCFIRANLGLFSPLEVVNLFLDCILLSDFFLTFNTGLLVEGRLVRSHAAIARDYLRTWAAIDLASSLPLTHMIRILGQGSKGLNAVKLTRLVKMMKFSRMLKIFKLVKLLNTCNEWDDDPSQQFYADVKHFVALVFGVVLMAHFAACAFIFIAGNGSNGWSARTWVATYFNEGRAMERSADLPTPVRLYVVAIYWAFTTLTTVGYGDVLPVSNLEMVLTILVQFVGTCTLGYVMGDVALLLTREDASMRLIKERIETVNAYMKHRNLPRSLKMQIRSHFSYLWQRNSIWDEHEILVELPQSLRSAVILHNNRITITRIQFLNDCPPQAIAALCVKFVATQVTPNTTVLVEGDMSHDFNVVNGGALVSSIRISAQIAESLAIEPDIVFRVLRQGDFFAEFALLTAQSVTNPYSVTAIVATELLLLSHEAYRQVSSEFPVIEARLRQLAETQFDDTLERLRDSHRLTGVRKRDDFGDDDYDDDRPRSSLRGVGRSLRALVALPRFGAGGGRQVGCGAPASLGLATASQSVRAVVSGLRRKLSSTGIQRVYATDADAAAASEELREQTTLCSGLDSILKRHIDATTCFEGLSHRTLLKACLWARRIRLKTTRSKLFETAPPKYYAAARDAAARDAAAAAKLRVVDKGTAAQTPIKPPRASLDRRASLDASLDRRALERASQERKSDDDEDEDDGDVVHVEGMAQRVPGHTRPASASDGSCGGTGDYLDSRLETLEARIEQQMKDQEERLVKRFAREVKDVVTLALVQERNHGLARATQRGLNVRL